jgi:hypothetical protein
MKGQSSVSSSPWSMNHSGGGSGKSSFSSSLSYLDDVVLLGSERLQVHMDCMNALGQVVAIEDVDDMGGSVRNMHDASSTLYYYSIASLDDVRGFCSSLSWNDYEQDIAVLRTEY